MSPTQAAADAGTATMIFALAVAGVLIVILGSLLWWLVRERLALTQRRFEAGTKKMEDHDQRLDSMVTRAECSMQHERHERQHEAQAQQIHDLMRSIQDLTERMTGLAARLDSSVQAMTRLLGSHITVGTVGEVRGDG